MKRSPIRKVSKKKAKYRGLRKLAVEMALARDEHCVGLDLIPGHVCSGPFLVGHEPLKRSAGGDIYDPAEIVMVCWGLNSAIESDADVAQAAREVGLNRSMGERYREGRYLKRYERERMA